MCYFLRSATKTIKQYRWQRVNQSIEVAHEDITAVKAHSFVTCLQMNIVAKAFLCGGGGEG